MLEPKFVPTRWWRIATVFLCAFCLVVVGREAVIRPAISWDLKRDRVSADLTDVPLRTVLEQIRVATGWEVAIEPGIERRISTTFQNLGSGDALERLLRDSNFALIQRTNRASRLLVFRTSRDRATEVILQEANESGSTNRIADEWIVTLKPGADADALAAKLGAKVVGRIDKLHAYRLKFDSAEAATAAKSLLAGDNSVSQVDANYSINRPDVLQPLSYAGGQLPQIKSAGNTSGQMIIGVVDTAVQIPGGDLGKLFLTPISVAGDFQPDGKIPTHGTGMSSDILNSMAAMVGQGGSVNAAILPVDVFGPNQDTSTFLLGQGIVDAWNGGATLINASIGSKADSPWLDSIINQLRAAGATIVAPAGNTPDGLPTYPAANPNVLAVTATEANGQLASYANMASFVDVAMPGNSIVNLTGLSYFMSGTSVATARATGVIAGYSLSTGQSISAGENYLLQTHGVQPGTQISP